MSRGGAPERGDGEGHAAVHYDRVWRDGAGRENRARWAFQAALVRRALERVGAKPGMTVLEIGPGPGHEAACLAAAGARVVAMDPAPAALERTRAASGGRAAVVAGLAEALPLRAAAVDRIFVQTVLMHVDLGRAAAEWARVLKPGGRVVVLEPLAGHPLVALYRRWLSPYRATSPRYITVEGLERAAREIVIECHEEHVLLGVLALALPGAPGRAARAVLDALDRQLLRLRPLRRFAWMTLAELGRRADGDRYPGHAPRS